MTLISSAAYRRGFGVALAYLNAGDLDAAATECRALLTALPDDPALLQLHATIALRSNDPSEALRAVEISLAMRPRHVPSLLVAARAALALGAPAKALPPLRAATAIAPDLTEPVFLMCRALLDLGDPLLDAAIKQAAVRHTDRPAEWQELGLALRRAGRPALALLAFTRASTADPSLVAAQIGRGLLLREAGQMSEAHAALTRAVTLDPAAAAAWFALGLTCQDLGDEFGAAAAYGAALAVRGDFAEAAVNRGIALQRLGDLPAALKAYQRAVAIRSDTLGRIAQALTAASTGTLWLRTADLRRALGA